MKYFRYYILMVFLPLFIFAQWNGPIRIGGFSSSFYPPVNSYTFASDKLGNSYTVFYTNGPDFYYAIALDKYDGSSWSYSRIDDSYGTGDYSLSIMPTISVEDDGKYLIVWEDKKTGYIELHYKYFDLVNIPSLQQITFDSAYVFFPKVLFKNNKHHLMYMSNKSGVFNIYYKTFDSLWSISENVYSTHYNIGDYFFSIDNNDAISIVFTMFDDYFSNLYYTKKEFGLFSPPISVFKNNSNVYYPSILSDSLRDYILYTANVSGINQLYLSIYENGIMSIPHLLSNNTSNIYYPKGLLVDSNLYVFYVSDELPDGVLYCDIYNKNTIKLISSTVLLKEKGGEIYAPQVTIDSNNRIILTFMCADTIHETVPNTFYYFYYDIIKKTVNMAKTYKLINNIESLIFLSTDTEGLSIEIYDKLGRIIYNDYSNLSKIVLYKDIFNKNDIYFARIIKKDKVFTEKLLIIK